MTQSSVISIGSYAFYNCSSLTSVTIPDGVTTIGNRAFGNSGITEVNLGSGIKEIGVGAFATESRLDKLNVKDITDYLNSGYAICSNEFYINGKRITELVIPEGVTQIPSYAFSKNKDFTSVKILGKAKTIGDHAFECCDKLKNVTFENACKKVGKSMFSSCGALTDITLPDTLETIDEDAFRGCSSLTEITLPHNVTEIESGAFNGCSKLVTVNYNGNEENWNDIFIGGNNDYLKNATRNYFWYVTLIDEKGEEISKKKYDLNALVDISDIEPKFEHTIHLFTDKACKNEFDFENTPITENLTLYLKYIPNQYNAKFVDDDGTVLQEELIDYGAVITPPQDPTKERIQKYTYTFIGWDGYTSGAELTDITPKKTEKEQR